MEDPTGILEMGKRAHELEFYYRRHLFTFKKQWRWRTVAVNGRVTGSSSESYYNKGECEDNARDVAKSILLSLDDMYKE
jgi:hypothetical protein